MTIANLNTKASYSLRLTVALQWTILAGLSRVKDFRLPDKAEIVFDFLIVVVPAALICVSILIDWFTHKEPSRRYAKLIDSLIFGAWLISVAYMIAYSLQMGII